MLPFQNVRLVIFLISVSSPVTHTEIAFWSGFDGFGISVKYPEDTLHKNCIEVPIEDIYVRSITTNVCILLYFTENCTGNVRHKFYNGTLNWGGEPSIQSWALCNTEQLGFNVDIYDGNKVIVKKISNLCKCVNIPENLLKEEILVYTENQRFLTFKGKYCTGVYSVSYRGKLNITSFQPFEPPYNCPKLNGIITDVTSFERTNARTVKLEPLEATTNYHSQQYDNITITLNGEDNITITTDIFLWTRSLSTCLVKPGLTLRHKLWEASWPNETEFKLNLVSIHCKYGDVFPLSFPAQKLVLHKTFSLVKNVSVFDRDGGTPFVQAHRGYVKDSFSYRLLLNISGVRTDNDKMVKASDLENSFPQMGLKFVNKLDDFTILVEAKAALESRFPVSTVYNISTILIPY